VENSLEFVTASAWLGFPEEKLVFPNGPHQGGTLLAKDPPVQIPGLFSLAGSGRTMVDEMRQLQENVGAGFFGALTAESAVQDNGPKSFAGARDHKLNEFHSGGARALDDFSLSRVPGENTSPAGW